MHQQVRLYFYPPLPPLLQLFALYLHSYLGFLLIFSKLSHAYFSYSSSIPNKKELRQHFN
jgi:hypothetical protein